MYHGRNMHIMSATNLRINGKQVRLSADRLARIGGIPAVRGGREPTMGPSQLWNGWPFVAIWNVPGQPSQSAPFLLSFSSALIVGRDVTHPSRPELSTGAAFLIGLPHMFSCREGDDKLAWEGEVEKLVQMEYDACEWVNPDLEGGVQALQAGFLDTCAQQLTPKA